MQFLDYLGKQRQQKLKWGIFFLIIQVNSINKIFFKI